jgi:hypothetical protein
MALQSSGAISLNNINTELGVASGTARSLGETSSRNLAGIASGAISLSDFYGKSNVQEIVFDNSAAAWGTPQNWNLWNILVNFGIALTSNKVKITLTNITITASATSVPALETGSGWPAGTLLEVIMGSGCVVKGKGGAGGAGSTGQAYAAAGGAGGPGYRVTAAISGGSITTTLSGGLVYGGGGGGGGGGGITYSTYGGDTGAVYTNLTGGTGGTGAGPAGQTNGTAGNNNGTWYAGAGGTGGTYGAAGNGGGAGHSNYGTSRPGTGGAGGAAIVNASLSTNVGWVANSNYFGAVA